MSSIMIPPSRKYYLTYEEMGKLNTKRLLAYKKKYLTNMHCHNRSHKCDGKDCSTCRDYPELQELQIAYKNIRDILSTREHIK